MPKGLVLVKLEGKQQQLYIHLLYESLVWKYEYTTQPKSSLWCHNIDRKGGVLLLIFIIKLALVLYLSFSRYLVE